jgi:hypothetical protein
LLVDDILPDSDLCGDRARERVNIWLVIGVASTEYEKLIVQVARVEEKEESYFLPNQGAMNYAYVTQSEIFLYDVDTSGQGKKIFIHTVAASIKSLYRPSGGQIFNMVTQL